jgi:hypothetical protein
MKIFIPCPARALSSRRAISSLPSSSSSSWRTRSRSAAAAWSMRLAWPRTISTGRLRAVLRPDGEPARDQLLRRLVERGLAGADLLAEPRLRLGERQAGQARADVIADLGQRAG